MARGHEQPRDPREVGDQIIGDAIAEIVVVRLTAHIGEGQHRDRRPLVRAWRRRRRCPRHHHAINPNRPRDVLDVALAEELDGAADPALEVVVGGAGERDAARLAQLLQARGDIHPIAVDVPARFTDDVAQIDADPEADALLLGHARLAVRHAVLDRDGAGHRIDDAVELAQRAVAHEVDDAAVVLGDKRLDELPAVRLEARERAGLVRLNQPRVADHVRRQDGGEATLRAEHSHRAASKTPRRTNLSAKRGLSYAGSHRSRNRSRQSVMSDQHPALWALLYLNVATRRP